jgi:hypothetical protein
LTGTVSATAFWLNKFPKLPALQAAGLQGHEAAGWLHLTIEDSAMHVNVNIPELDSANVFNRYWLDLIFQNNAPAA